MLRRFFLTLALAALTAPAFSEESAAPKGAPGEEPKPDAALFALVCAQCHGEKGEGRADLKTPAIASLPDWYVVAQIEKFQNDIRGTVPGDTEGPLMHGIAKSLTAQQVREVALAVEALPMIRPRKTLKGDTDLGREIFQERCMECHRYNGKGELVFMSAQLIGFQDWYIFNQLKKFKAGLRGAHPEDEKGAKMHLVAGFLTEEEMRGVATYLMDLAERHGPWAERVR